MPGFYVETADEEGNPVYYTSDEAWRAHKEEIRSVGFRAADYGETAKKYDPEKLQYGYNEVDGEEIYFIPNPALGLWINREKFEE